MRKTKLRPQNSRVYLVLKHFGPYFVRIFVHTFALYVGREGHSRVSDSQHVLLSFFGVTSTVSLSETGKPS